MSRSLQLIKQFAQECGLKLIPLVKQVDQKAKNFYLLVSQRTSECTQSLEKAYQAYKPLIRSKADETFVLSKQIVAKQVIEFLQLKAKTILLMRLYAPKVKGDLVRQYQWALNFYKDGLKKLKHLAIQLKELDCQKICIRLYANAKNYYYFYKNQPWKQFYLDLVHDIKALRKIDLRKVLICIVCGLYGVTSWSDVPDEIKVLIEQKKPKDAYELGLRHPEMMGDPLFDYFFGVAAVEAGRASYGVLALERVLLSNPNDDLARLELARAYFTIGDYQRAREEFEIVKKSRPPAGVVSTINIYLDAIDRKEGELKVQYGVYGELGIGYSNNVNTAAAINNIILPYVGPVQLSTTSQPQPSMFSYTLIGANVSVPVGTNTHVFANVNNSAQRYSQVNGYDLNVTNATTGVKTIDGDNEYKVVGFGSLAKLDQVPVPNTLGAGVEYVRHLTGTQSILLGGGTSSLAYGSQYGAYDSNLSVATAGYRKTFPTTKWSPVVDVMANVANQNNTSNRPDLGRKIAGGNVQLSMLPTDKLGISVGAGYARSNYGGTDPLFLTNRSDNLLSGNAVVQYKLTKDLSARAEFTYFNNQSNINLYGYEQWTGALKLRYEWNSN